MRAPRNQDGLSIIEIMVAIGILAIGARFLVELVGATSGDYLVMVDRLVANQIVEQNVAGMKSNSGIFPPVQDRKGQPGFYVVCSNRKGIPTIDATGKPIRVVNFGNVAGTSSGRCAGSEVETQYAPSSANPTQLTVYVIFYKRGGSNVVASVHQQQFRLDRNL